MKLKRDISYQLKWSGKREMRAINRCHNDTSGATVRRKRETVDWNKLSILCKFSTHSIPPTPLKITDVYRFSHFTMPRQSTMIKETLRKGKFDDDDCRKVGSDNTVSIYWTKIEQCSLLNRRHASNRWAKGRSKRQTYPMLSTKHRLIKFDFTHMTDFYFSTDYQPSPHPSASKSERKTPFD